MINLKINGYKETSDGKILDYEYLKTEKIKKKKYSDYQIKIITELYEELKEHKYQLKSTLIELKKKDIIISSQTLKKIINKMY